MALPDDTDFHGTKTTDNIEPNARSMEHDDVDFFIPRPLFHRDNLTMDESAADNALQGISRYIILHNILKSN